MKNNDNLGWLRRLALVLGIGIDIVGTPPASEVATSVDGGGEQPIDRILHSGKFNWTYVLGSGLMDPLYRGKTVIVHEGKNDAERRGRMLELLDLASSR